MSAPTRSARPREFVHEADARRQHGVGRVLGEFGAARIHQLQLVAVARKRRVDRPHQQRRALVVGADDDPVGAHEVVDRGAFLEELRVADHGEVHADRPRSASTSCTAARTRSAVPTGTVLLSTMTL
jgi:hypothetical protein